MKEQVSHSIESRIWNIDTTRPVHAVPQKKVQSKSEPGEKVEDYSGDGYQAGTYLSFVKSACLDIFRRVQFGQAILQVESSQQPI